MLELVVYEENKKEQKFTYAVDSSTAYKIKNIIDEYLTTVTAQNTNYLSVKKQDKIEHIPLKNVLYFISDKRKINAIFEFDASLDFYMKMSDLEKQLHNSTFLRCHQSYLVNKNYILHWNEKYITLVGNKIIPISRKYKDCFINLK